MQVGANGSSTRGTGRRRVAIAAIAVAVVIAGVGTDAFGAADKPAGPVTAPAPARPTVDQAWVQANARAAAASPSSTHAPSTADVVGTASSDGAVGAAAAAPISTDPALHPVDLAAIPQPAGALAAVRTTAATKGSVRVIVTLRTTFQALGAQDRSAAAQQRSTVQSLSDTASAVATANGGTVNRTYDGNIPAVAITATPATLDALAASPAVAQITEDGVSHLQLAESGPLIGAADAYDRGYGGAGTAIAVLDTGVDYDHPFFHGRVTNAACYSTGATCPNGQTSQVGGNAGIPCNFIGCAHGTHVAGIAAGAAEGTHDFNGIAPLAKIESIQVFHLDTCSGSPCASASDSDILAGLNRAYVDRGIGTAAVNLSLGGGKYSGNCDATFPATKTAIDNLRSAGIATVVSSGNQFYTDAVVEPACISTATTVGATDKTDVVTNFSNSSPLVDFYAPGKSILSAYPSGDQYVYDDGTSMAAPHVAGAMAVMRSWAQGVTVDLEEYYLDNSGLIVTDAKSGIRRRRINVLQAIAQEYIYLTNDGVRDLRNPIPYDHLFGTQATTTYWSAVAVRPPAGADYDMTVYGGGGGDGTGALDSSVTSGDAVDFVAQDGNRRGSNAYTFPHVHKFSGTGRYQIEYANDATTIGDGMSTISMGSSEVIEIRDTLMSAGVPTYFRVSVENAGQDPELFLMESTAGNAGTYFRDRGGAAARSSAQGIGGDESFAYSAPAGQWDGLVLINRAGDGTYTLYRDTSPPTGSMVIEPGNPASVNKRSVVLQIAADDPQTGILDMRVAADGVADTEPWVPYAATAPVTLPSGAGVKTVQVQVRDNANAVSTFTDTVTLDARANYKVTAVSNPPATAVRGATFNVTDSTKNFGLTATTVTSSNKYYLSLNTAYDVSDVQLTGVRTVPALANGATNTGSRSLTVPATVPKGSYFLITCADTTNTVNEFSESDNCKASSGKVAVQVADYTVTSVANPPATKARGATFTATDTTKNAGTLAATAASKTRYYLSVDGVKDVSDRLLAPGRTVNALAVSALSTGSVTVTIPTGTAVGTYKLLACADDLSQVDESSESNNCKASGGSINVT